MATTSELILRFSGDPRQLRQTMAQLRPELSQFTQGQVAGTQTVARQAQQSEQRRVADTIRSANQRLREEQRAAREVARITAETARQAAAQDRVRERAAKQLADARIREAKRSARELERSLGSGAGAGSGVGGLVSSITGSIPGIGGLSSQFTSISAAATGAGGAIASFAIPIAGAVTAAAALAAGLAFLGKTFFDLTVATAEFQGKFRDLSQQVGVSAESLSTLDFFAQTTGGNIESVTVSLGIFQKNLEAAHDPTSEQAKLMKDLGVTSLDTETALRQAIAGIFKLGETSKQTDSALKAFGRSGRFVNAIAKESEGDFNKAAEAAAKYGRLVSTEAAIAADRFNDSLIILQGQIASVTRSLTQDSIPVFIAFFDQISAGLAKNSKDWQGWSTEISRFVAFTLAGLKTLAQFAASGLTIPLLSFNEILFQNFSQLLKQTEQLRGQIDVQANLEAIQRITAAALAGKPGDRPDPKKAASEAQARANKDIQLQQQRLEESTRAHRIQLERERDLELKNIEQWRDESAAIVTEHDTEQNRILDRELANFRQFIKNKADLVLAEREVLQKRLKLANETLEARQKIDDEAQKRRDATALKELESLFRLTEAERQGRLDIVKRHALLESEVLKAEVDARRQQFDERKAILKQEEDALSTTASRQKEIRQELLILEQSYTNDFERLSEQRRAALTREVGQQVPAPGSGGTVPTAPVRVDVGLPPPETLEMQIDAALRAQGAFAGLGTAISDAIGLGQEGAIAFGEALTQTFGQLANAVGEAVHAFILFGTVQGGFRKFAAEVIASIAQMAVVQAVWEAAQGLAMLALTWFTGNPKYAQSAGAHFAAAAAYGLIAGAAVPIGRAVAGNQFNQAGAGGGGSAGNSFGNRPEGELNPITLPRNQPQTQTIIVRIVPDESMFGKAIETVVLKNVQGAGRLRQAFADDQII